MDVERDSGDGRHPGEGRTPDPRARLLAGLTEPQRHAVLAPDETLCVLAAAGSGKTRVLTRRVARRILDGSADADHVQVLTFTRKAAAELRSRLADLGVGSSVRTGTFHAAAFAQLRRHWADQGRRAPVLVDDPAAVLRTLSDAAEPGHDRSRVAARVRVLSGEIEWAQSRLLAPEAYPAAARRAGRRPRLAFDDVATAYAAYREAKVRRGLVDLHDLVDQAATLVEEDAALAAAVRWRTRHLFVDEFQDVNPAQWRLLRAWLGDRRDLFVVGDPNQAVYSWNGADPGLLLRLPQLLPGTRVARLDDNHRSTPQVLRAAAAVLGDATGPTAAPDTPDGPAPVIEVFEDDEAEARAVIRWLRLAHHPGRPWSHLAVLARTNARLEAVVAALRRSGIPFRVRAAGAYGDPAFLAALQALRRLPSAEPLRGGLASLGDVSDPPAPEGGAGADAPSVRAAVARLRGLADELAAEDPDATVGTFLAWLTATFDEPGDAPGRSDRVEVATFHRAKGLEWPAVAVIGLEAGLVPIAHARTAAQLDEERRLLYVALTRARRELWCSWAARRSVAGSERPCEPSPFLAAVRAAADAPTETAGSPAMATPFERIAALRARLPVAAAP